MARMLQFNNQNHILINTVSGLYLSKQDDSPLGN
jgi:hypothetical protein